MRNHLTIDGINIGPNEPPYIIAEISANHNGSIDRAIELIRKAKAAGAHAIKLQTYTADTMTIDSEAPDFILPEGNTWAGQKLYDLYTDAAMPWEWHDALFEEAKKLGITAFSTPYEETAVTFLEEFDVPVYKIASFEMNDLPLIRRIAETGRPVIMSTGIASLEEIDEAVATLEDNGCKELVLLHCVSGYPSMPSEANLATIPALAQRYGCAVGLSDHTLGIGVSVASISMGACMIEKHFTLRRADGGPDSSFSLEPEELAALVSNCAVAFEAQGAPNFKTTDSEQYTMNYGRSLYVVNDIQCGDTLTPENIRSIRPGFGLAPKYYDEVIGKTATRDLKRGEPLRLEDLS